MIKNTEVTQENIDNVLNRLSEAYYSSDNSIANNQLKGQIERLKEHFDVSFDELIDILKMQGQSMVANGVSKIDTKEFIFGQEQFNDTEVMIFRDMMRPYKHCKNAEEADSSDAIEFLGALHLGHAASSNNDADANDSFEISHATQAEEEIAECEIISIDEYTAL